MPYNRTKTFPMVADKAPRPTMGNELRLNSRMGVQTKYLHEMQENIMGVTQPTLKTSEQEPSSIKSAKKISDIFRSCKQRNSTRKPKFSPRPTEEVKRILSQLDLKKHERNFFSEVPRMPSLSITKEPNKIQKPTAGRKEKARPPGNRSKLKDKQTGLPSYMPTQYDCNQKNLQLLQLAKRSSSEKWLRRFTADKQNELAQTKSNGQATMIAMSAPQPQADLSEPAGRNRHMATSDAMKMYLTQGEIHFAHRVEFLPSPQTCVFLDAAEAYQRQEHDVSSLIVRTPDKRLTKIFEDFSNAFKQSVEKFRHQMPQYHRGSSEQSLTDSLKFLNRAIIIVIGLFVLGTFVYSIYQFITKPQPVGFWWRIWNALASIWSTN